MKRTAFDILNKEFEQKTPDPSIFDTGEFNLIKIYQHALIARINQVPLYVRAFWKWPFCVQQLVLFLKRLKNNNSNSRLEENLETFKKGNTLIYAGGNIIVENDENYCITVEKILRTIGKENSCFIFSNYQGRNTKTNQDFDIDNLRLIFENQAYNQQEKELIKQIKKTRKQLKGNPIYNEDIQHFDQFIQIFLINFKVWNRIIEILKPQNAFISTHYHNEPLIAALKQAKIQVCELQHGLISSEDLYYSYKQESISKFRDRMLLADRILVFGCHWKNILDQGNEYSQEQILISGNHIYRPEIRNEELEELRTKYGIVENKAILISAQKRLAKQFASYTNMLAEKLKASHPEYRIIIKPHPGQADLELLTDCDKHENTFVASKTDSIHTLFSICNHQVSIYSTTFYDAIGFDIENHSIIGYPETDNFAQEMIQMGIAKKLDKTASPLDSENELKDAKIESREFYYQDYDSELIERLVNA